MIKTYLNQINKIVSKKPDQIKQFILPNKNIFKGYLLGFNQHFINIF